MEADKYHQEIQRQRYQALLLLASDAAEAAYLAIEGIGKLSPVIERRLNVQAWQREEDFAIINGFSEEMSLRLCMLARTIAEEEDFLAMDWEGDARITLPVMYELGAAYTLLAAVVGEEDLLKVPPVSKPTLQRLATKELRAWLDWHLSAP